MISVLRRTFDSLWDGYSPRVHGYVYIADIETEDWTNRYTYNVRYNQGAYTTMYDVLYWLLPVLSQEEHKRPHLYYVLSSTLHYTDFVDVFYN